MSLMRTESRKTRELCWQTFGRICLDHCEMRLVQEGVLDVLSELVAGDDYMLKRNSAAILALLCENAETRTKTVSSSHAFTYATLQKIVEMSLLEILC